MTPESLVQDIHTALSYAPIGVRDSASRSLQELLASILSPTLDAMDEARKHHPGLPDFAPKLLSLEAERKKLQGAYEDAVRGFKIIAGQACSQTTHEATAREWLGRHNTPEKEMA